MSIGWQKCGSKKKWMGGGVMLAVITQHIFADTQDFHIWA